MICEYVLEPELVATWHDRERFHYFSERFGFGSDGRATGRVVAQYPGKWKKRIWDAFAADSGQPAEYFAKRRRIEILLAQLGSPQVLRSGSVWNDQCTWLENAEEENMRRPFHAILANDNPRNNPLVMREDDVLGMDPPSAWRVPREIPVHRTATSMATHLDPMLRCATRILFIDPYFRASELRWRNPLQAFLNIICDGSREVTLECHASACYQNSPSWDIFLRECKTHLPRLIPRGFTLTVRRWEERNVGEELHDRYILTDIGGVVIPRGLDESDEYTLPEKDRGTIDILRVSFETWQQRLEDYGYDSKPAFAQEGKIVIEVDLGGGVNIKSTP